MTACGVFVDLLKAFDTVNHEILLRKLNHYCILANKWFSSYISQRSQFVSIRGFNSTTELIKHGVPQGSVLGPLLFLIYKNDLHNAIKYSKVYHFADDTNLLKIAKSSKQLQKHLNLDLRFLYNWLLSNKISLNCAKTEIIMFNKPGHLDDFKFKIKINGLKILPSSSIKYLGIYLDKTLNGQTHCNILKGKLRRANGILMKARHYLLPNDLISIYHTIFSSHLIYGAQVWGQNRNTHNENIFKLQNNAMRIIHHANPQADSSPIFKEHHILKLQDQVTLQNILFVYDTLNESSPYCFRSYFTKICDTHKINTRYSGLGCLSIPQMSTTRYGLHSITKKCISNWNKLTNTLGMNLAFLSRSVLKTKIQNYFLDKY